MQEKVAPGRTPPQPQQVAGRGYQPKSKESFCHTESSIGSRAQTDQKGDEQEAMLAACCDLYPDVKLRWTQETGQVVK